MRAFFLSLLLIANAAIAENVETFIAAQSPTGWFDASNAGSITIATGVSNWTSKGSALTFTQSTGGAQPTRVLLNSRYCLNFDGSDDELGSASDSTDFLGSGNATIIAVLETDSNVSSQYILRDNWGGWFLRQNTTGLLGHYSNDGSADEAFAGIASGVPYVVEATYDGTNLGVTVNGQTTQTDASDGLGLGSTFHISGGGAQFDGRLCELITFDKYLSPAKRQKIRRYLQKKWGLRTHTIPEPILHLQMEENAADTNVYNTIGGTAYTALRNTSTFTNATGKLGRALDFLNGGTQDAVLTGAVILTTGNATITSWVAVDTAAGSGGDGTWFDDGVNRVRVTTANSAIQVSRNGGAVFQTYNNAWSAGVWKHWALVYTGSTAKFYIDGVLQTAAAGSITISGSPGNLTIGNLTPNIRTIDGDVDDFRVYNQALTPADIQWIYKSGTGRAESRY